MNITKEEYNELLSCTVTLFLVVIALVVFLVVDNTEIKKKEKDSATTKYAQVLPNSYKGKYIVTYYTHTGYNTSTGVYPKSKRTIAVDPKVIPYGTFLYIEGVGYGIAEDTGKDIKGNRLDVFVDSREQAISLGRKKAKVYVLEEKKEN